MTNKTPPSLINLVDSELKQLLRAVKLGKLIDTLPERGRVNDWRWPDH
jgi:hypothetical protein